MEPLLCILQLMHPHPSQVICYLLQITSNSWFQKFAVFKIISEILQALLESKTGICIADRKFSVCGIK